MVLYQCPRKRDQYQYVFFALGRFPRDTARVRQLEGPVLGIVFVGVVITGLNFCVSVRLVVTTVVVFGNGGGRVSLHLLVFTF